MRKVSDRYPPTVLAIDLILVITMSLSVMALVSIFNLSRELGRSDQVLRSTADLQNTTACRTRIAQELEQDFRTSIGRLFLASLNDDQEEVQSIVKVINSGPTYRGRTQDECPEALREDNK